MEPRNDRRRLRDRARRLLDSRDWLYVLALLVPLAIYNLSLKALRVASLPEEHSLVGALKLMRSDLLFNAGYALVWIGLFAVLGHRHLRPVVVVTFHAAAILVALVAAGAYQFYGVTGSTLDSGTITFFLAAPAEVAAVVAS